MRAVRVTRRGPRWCARCGPTVLHSFRAVDTRVLYRIRNDRAVRANMSDRRPLSYRRHRHWVLRNLVRRRTLELYIVRQSGRPVGIGLLRNFEGKRAEFGMMFRDSDRHGIAAFRSAVLVLDHAFAELELERLSGYIVRGNTRSLRFGLGLGARRVACERAGHLKVEFTAPAFYAAPAVVHTLARRDTGGS